MYSYNKNLKKQFAKSRSESNMEKRNRNYLRKLETECESYVRRLRPPKHKWFAIGSIKKSFFSFKKTYLFMMTDYGYVRYIVKTLFSNDIVSKVEDLENIAEIIAKKKAEEALSSITSKAR